MVDDLIAMRIELRGHEAQGGRLAHAGLAGQQAEARRLQKPLEAFGELRQRTVIPQLGGFLAQRRMAQTKVLQIHLQSPLRS
jgi:hypothetical protein